MLVFYEAPECNACETMRAISRRYKRVTTCRCGKVHDVKHGMPRADDRKTTPLETLRADVGLQRLWKDQARR